MRVSKEYRAALMAKAAKVRESIARTQGDDAEIYSYVEDPEISLHDKELQGALDYDMVHPDVTLQDLQRQYDEVKDAGPYYFSGFLVSEEEERKRLKEALSDESVAELWAEYERWLALRDEAIAKGFVRYGNCRNVRRNHG